ncbi:MAG: hypothetical protein ABWZ82_04675 [Candidatus Limnocylindrales bacterium]
MSTTRVLPRIDAWATFAWTVRAAWHELVAVIGVSVAWAFAGMPLVIALGSGEPWLAAIAALPLCIATTALFGTLADVATGGAVRRPGRDRWDPTLGALAWAWVVVVAGAVGMGPSGVLAASLAGALGILVLPLAFAYGAVRGRRGVVALRAAMIIAILHPGLALTFAGVACLAAFACVASAGVLLVVAPAFVALMACRAVVVLLAEDEA